MRRPFALALMLPALMSCGLVLEPDDIRGAFALEGVPVVLHVGDGHLEIIADTLRVNSNGTAARHLTETGESPTGQWVSVRVEPYRYAIRNGILEFELICPPNALCMPPPHIWGTRTRTGLALRSIVDPEVPLHYRRVGSW